MSDTQSIQELTDALVPRMVSVRHWHDASFVRLPLVYPSGSFVAVRLSRARAGIKISDAGFAYQEADSFGAGRSFANTARSIADAHGVRVGKRALFADVSLPDVERAIFDVSAASQEVAERIVARASEGGDISVSEVLHDRLERLFREAVNFDDKVAGASTTEWDVSAVASLAGKRVIFQAVTNYPASIYKTSTAFHDLAALDRPPGLVAVVTNKNELGPSLNILSQAGRVIEVSQADDVYMRAAG